MVGVAACGGTPPQARRPAPPPTTPPGATAATATQPSAAPAAKPKAKPKPKPKPDPGRLPQTDRLPSADSRSFHAEMLALWSGVQANSPARARAAFFPEVAYVQVKSIGDPQGDYAGRLLADYELDLAAAHALLGLDARSAQLVGVHVPAGYAHWIPPGVCDNRVGYYELSNARVVYRQGGALHSFGIASMISWRGVWYVIHLGAILRPSSAGVVDDPSLGAGSSAPSSTC